MTLDHEHSAGDHPQPDEDILRELDHIDDGLLGGLSGDERLQDGVPDDQRTEDLDFIQMTGLARPGAEEEDTAGADADARKPVSFYQKGIADVDSSMAPGTVGDGENIDDEIVPEAAAEEPIRELREILAELRDSTQGTEDDAVTDSAGEDEIEGLYPRRGESIDAALQDDTFDEEDPGAVVHIGQSAGEDVADLDRMDDAYVFDSEEEAAEVDAKPVRTSPRRASPDLLEAERLVQELQDQPRDLSSTPVPEAPSGAVQGIDEDGVSDEEDEREEDEDSVAGRSREAAEEAIYRKPAGRRGRRRSGLQGKSRLRSFMRVCLLLVLLAGVVAASYKAYEFVERLRAAPGAVFEKARELAEKREYRRASAAFRDFAQTFSSHPLRAEAQFQAAILLQGIAPRSDQEVTHLHQESLALLDAYISQNPNDDAPRVARARVLRGRLLAQLDRFEESIAELSDSALSAQDPLSALPVLRTLADVYAKMGDYEKAEEMYLKAAQAEGNYTPDEDYSNLAQLHEAWMARAASAAEQEAHRAAARQFWTMTLRGSAITAAARQRIESRIAQLAGGQAVEGVMEPGLEGMLQDPMSEETTGIPQEEPHGGLDAVPAESTAPAPVPPADGADQTEPANGNPEP